MEKTKDLKKAIKTITDKLTNKKEYDKLKKEEKESIFDEFRRILVECDLSYYQKGVALIPNKEYDKLEILYYKLEKELKGWNK